MAFLAHSQTAMGQDGWNSPEALELVERARLVRQSTVTEVGLQSYAAEALGYVYFFVDREDDQDHTLVKIDQLALQVFWGAPDRTHQIIVGRRDEEQLPTRIRYHLDHLTVVQDDFGDRIRMGEGDEVSAVLHPLAPASERLYDFRRGDSLTVRFPGREDPVRVIEILVRPADPDVAAFVGSVFVDRSSAAVVRMRFTFTPSAYVDPNLDHIRVSLDNALWEGRYWLPYRQEVEIRREALFLDLPFGTVIRGRFEISGYRLNEALPPGLFRGPRVTTVSPEARRAFVFERGLYDGVEDGDLGPAPDLDEVRDQAAELARRRYLSGLAPVRLYAPNASSVFRTNRAEGAVLGAGMSLSTGPGPRIRSTLAYAFGRERLQVRIHADGGGHWPGSSLAVFLGRPRDIGPVPASSGVVNTLAVLARSADFQDLHFVSGVEARQQLEIGASWDAVLTARWERHGTANDVLGEAGATVIRPVLPTEEGDLLALDLEAGWRLGEHLEAGATATLASFEERAYSRVHGTVAWSRSWIGRRADLTLSARGGLASDDVPDQGLFLLGGRATLPGYRFRSFAGEAFWLLRADAGHGVFWPWFGLRAFAALGGTESALADLPAAWDVQVASSPRASVGLGADLLWNIVRVEVGRGLAGDGDWQVDLFASTRFWPIL